MSNNKKLEAVFTRAANNLVNNGLNYESDIQSAITEMEDGQKFTMGFNITLDLEKNKLSTKLSWSKKYAICSDSEIPDPDQTELQFEVLSPTEEE